jgi:hypothetical protein
LTGLLKIRAMRSAGVIGPSRADGGRITQRSTIDAVPSPSRKETSASPLPSSVITLAVSSLGLGRNMFAAAFTASWSLGSSACCTRLPSSARTFSGTSRGFCVTK